MTDILAILSDEDLQALATGYDRPFLTGAAAGMIGYAKAQGLATWIGDTIYKAGLPATSLEYFERELVITAVVAAERDVFVLSGHIYWLLMEYLARGDASIRPVEKIADTLMTVAAYRGVNNFRLSRQVVEDVLKVLKAAVVAKTTRTQDILPLMVTAFPPR
jgi:alkylhydroperoxidase/carboxymuconolactone decarboxylase family protein YurZ